MKVLDELYDMLEQELSEITSKGKLSVNELDIAEKLVCTMEKIVKMEAMDDYSEDSSYDYMYPRSRMPSRRGYSRDDMSMRRGYSRRGSYDNGYSGHTSREQMIRRLEIMMDEAPSDEERRIITDCIKQLDK